MLTIIFAALLTLSPGDNPNPAGYGQVAAIRATTQAATATVGVYAVTSARTWTNTYQTVITPHRRYDFVITNYDGAAAIATNTWDTFDYSDWMIGGITNMIVGPVTPSTVPVTNTVVAGQALAAVYTVTNTLGTVSVSGHTGAATPEGAFVYGDTIYVSGAADGDEVKMILK